MVIFLAVMEKALEQIQHIEAAGTNTSAAVCKSIQLCSYIGCGNPVTLYDFLGGCSCDIECTHFGDCCWDYESSCGGVSESPGFGFGGMGGFGLGGFGTGGITSVGNGDNFEIPDTVGSDVLECISAKKYSYRFVVRCPRKWEDANLRGKCEAPPSHTDVLSLIPVALGTKVTFANTYCALCHGVGTKNLTTWSVDIYCGSDIPDEDTSQRLERFKQGLCNYSYDDTVFRTTGPYLRHCRLDMINECPDDFENIAISEACQSFRAPILKSLSDPGYSNMYCLECNHPNHNYSDFAVCTTEVPAANIPPAGFPLTILVNFQDGSGIQVKVDNSMLNVETEECPPDYVYDSFARFCRALTCADGYVLREGKCTWEVTCTHGVPGLDFQIPGYLSGVCHSLDKITEVRNCIGRSFEISTDKLILLSSNASYFDTGYCIHSGANESLLLQFQISESLSFSELGNHLYQFRNISATLCGVGNMIYHVSCEDHEGFCHTGWKSLGNEDIEIVNEGNTSHVVFSGEMAKERYQPRAVRRAAHAELGVVPKDDGFINESVQICGDYREKSIARVVNQCLMVTFNASEFISVQNGNETMMLHIKSQQLFGTSEYELTDMGEIQVCSFFADTHGVGVTSTSEILEYSAVQSILSTLCVTVSMASLLTSFSAYVIFPALRKLTNNKLVMALCLFLLISQLLTVVGSYAAKYPSVCKFISVVTHFSWMSVFALTNSLAYDLQHTFGYKNSFSFAQSSLRSLIRYIIYVPGASLCVIVPCLCVDLATDSKLLDYTFADQCWMGDHLARFMAFGVPLIIFLAINIILFSYTAVGIWSGHQNAKKVGRKNLRPSFQERFDLLKIYMKVIKSTGKTFLRIYILTQSCLT